MDRIVSVGRKDWGMCDSAIISRRTSKPIEISDKPYKFIHKGSTNKEDILLEGCSMKGLIKYAAFHEIKNQFGVKKGYAFILGTEMQEE